MTKWGLFQEYKAVSIFEKAITVVHHTNQLKKRNHMIVSPNSQKALDKIQHPL